MIPTGHRCSYIRAESSTSTAPQPLPPQWNASTTSNYAFRYAHTQSSLLYLVKVSRLGSKVVINGLGIGDEKVHSVDLIAKDFVPESSLPYTTPTAAKSEASNDERDDNRNATDAIDENQIAPSLRRIFISAGRMTDAGNLLKLQIIQKLAPGLQKEGYEESAHAASHHQTSSQQQQQQQQQPGRRDPAQQPPARDPLRDDRLPPLAQPRPFDDPLAAAPRRPFPAGDFPPPGFEDEYEMNRPPRGYIGGGGGGEGGMPGERRPLNIGERDLYPPGLGPHDPLRTGGGGGFGVGGGGMHPTFDDPMFGGGAGPAAMYDPRAPPGARYDPVGPDDGPPMGRGGGPRFPGGGGAGGRGGAPPNPFGGFGGNDFI